MDVTSCVYYVYTCICVLCQCTMGLLGKHEVRLMIRMDTQLGKTIMSRRQTSPKGSAVGFLRESPNTCGNPVLYEYQVGGHIQDILSRNVIASISTPKIA